MIGVFNSLWGILGEKGFEFWGKVYQESYSTLYTNLYQLPDRWQWPRTGYGDYVLNKYRFELGLSINPMENVNVSGSISYTPYNLGQDSWNNYYGNTSWNLYLSYNLSKAISLEGGYSHSIARYKYVTPVPPWELDPDYWELINNLKNNNIQVNMSLWVGFRIKAGR